MKIKIVFFIPFVFFSILAFGQTTFISSDQSISQDSYQRSQCLNYNSFKYSESYPVLQEITYSIFPNGVMKFDPFQYEEIGGFEGLKLNLGLGDDDSFVLKSSNQNYSGTKIYERFTQFYKGVEVENSGYLVTTVTDGGGGSGGHPCGAQAYMMTPSIANDINISVIPGLPNNNVLNILSEYHTANGEEVNIIDEKLVIFPNALMDCEYHLSYRVEYNWNGRRKAWINAQNGSILRTISGVDNTIPQEEEESSINNKGFFKNQFTYQNPPPAGPIFIHDLANINCTVIDQTAGTINFIPETTVLNAPIVCPVTPSDPNAFDVLNRMNCIVQVFEELSPSTSFDTIHIGINVTCNNAISYLGGLPSNSTLLIGSGLEQVDVLGHELGHVFINQFFSSRINEDERRSRAVHEGFSDIFGEFAEYMCTGSNDFLRNNGSRDLSRKACPDDFPLDEYHNRGQVIGHWFFLLSEGDPSLGINGMGMENAMEFALEVLEAIPVGDVSLKSFGETVLAVAQGNFDLCSDEGFAIHKALEVVCLIDDFPGCNFSIDGQKVVCEEGNKLELSIGNGVSFANYSWTFPIGWSVEGNVLGNQLTGTALNVTQFPTYPYYPQTFNICVYSPNMGPDYKKCTTVKLRDCDRDDPTCWDYYSWGRKRDVTKNQLYIRSEDIYQVKFFNLFGKLLYIGSYEKHTIELEKFSDEKVFIVAFYDKAGNLLKSEKKININR